ncbi:hypothetical protein EDD18DRAFT_1353724 [Armillaria luteobubalina]|uniref:Aminoglycoside phosphotransferase domain-containing protein n=1 Tax=Armillaria luteobubalina TaxID=153913 RepID=A0AA39Q725_9AGAR|nr:hypothetical protein EDD18DRAFT_1353724 [Armillaria luteobubalina]
MSAPNYGFLANGNIPSRETIVAVCQEAGYECRGIPLRNHPSGPIVAWVKYGANVTIAEALTQDWVAKYLSADPAARVRVPRVHMVFSIDNPEYCIGYIVMEYIGAPDCDKSDYQLVSGAVEKLISIPGPTSAPGPVGGGRIIHTFFIDQWTSPITYDTVDDLQEHVNGVLKYKGDSRRVDLVADACAGLRLCPCDITPANFKKCEDGTVVALDFRATCFLPPCFFAVAVRMLVDNFSRKVARRVSYPQSSDVDAILSASYFMVPFGNNNIGIPKRLRLPKKL